jgi:dipeptidyl aminopeptidase/acylaminoacyl peptidase
MRKSALMLALALAMAGGKPAMAREVLLRPLIEMARLSSPVISPDGRMLAWREVRASIDRNDYSAVWIVMPVDASSPPRHLADAGEPDWLNGAMLPETPVWSADSSALYFRKISGGEVHVWKADLHGSPASQVTFAAGNVEAIQALENGGRLLVAVGPARSRMRSAEDREYENGTLIDASVDPSRALYRGNWREGRWSSARLRGPWFAEGGILEKNEPDLEVLDTATGTVRPASPSETSQYGPARGHREDMDGKRVAMTVPAGDRRGDVLVLSDGQGSALAVASPGAPPRYCGADACRANHIYAVTWLGDRPQVLFETRPEPNRSRLHIWNIETGAVRTLLQGEGLLEGGDDMGAGCAASAALLVCVEASANVPPRLVGIDVTTGERHILAEPNRALADLGPTFRRMQWTDTKGRDVTGYLALPLLADGSVPLFVNYYLCGGYLRGGLGDEYPMRDLANRGIATLCLNRAPSHDGPFPNVEAYRIAADGIGSVIDKLAREGLVDPSRVGIGGVSFGGEVALWMAMHTRRIRALSVANVMLTPTYYWFNALAGRDVAGKLRSGWGVGHPDMDRQGWRQVSGAFNTDRMAAPLLMQLPEQEYRPTVELLARLQAAGKGAELWAFPGEMHIKWQPVHQYAANVRNLDWFAYWFLGDIDPDPAKAGQYQRWRGYGSPSQARSQASVSMSGKSP